MWNFPNLAGKIWKIPDLAGKIWKIPNPAGKIWKIQDLTGKICKFPDLATHHSQTRCSNSQQTTHQLAGPPKEGESIRNQ